MYVRKLDQQTLTLIVSGMLWRNSLVMMDEETGSLWSHVVGEALQGPLKGRVLQTLPAVQTSWANWIKQHPGTKVLKKNEQITSSAYESYFKNPNRMGLFRTLYLRDRMPGKTLIYGVSEGVDQLAVVDSVLKPGQPLETSLGVDKIIILKSIDGGVRVFRNEGYTFEPVQNQDRFRDTASKSLWDLNQGICLGGKLKGKHLKPVSVTPAYWFAWSTYYPRTAVLD